MRIGWAAGLLLAMMLGGCAGPPPGLPADGFLTPQIGQAYLPLKGAAYVVLEGVGAAVVIAPGIAVTNAHNANLVGSGDVIGVSTDYDLLFFRTERRAALPEGEPRAGERVIAYGHGIDDELRMAEGRVRWTDAPVLPRCQTCAVQHAFVFAAQGGKGFSGGPVVDLKTGRLVGIVFGFRDGVDDKTPADRLMYAYDMKRVREELALARRQKTPASP